VTDIV